MWKVQMSKHIEIKHKIKNINRKTDFNSLLEESMLSDVEKQMMNMYYVENKSINISYTNYKCKSMLNKIYNFTCVSREL